MSAAAKIAILHVISLGLCAPLFIAYAATSDQSTSGVSWALVGAGLVYLLVVATGRPESLFTGIERLGLGRRSARLAISTVASIFLSVVFLDAGGMGSIIGIVLLGVAGLQFIMAVKSSYEIAPDLGSARG